MVQQKKTDFNTKVTEIENKIPDACGLVSNATRNTEITEFEGKIFDTMERLQSLITTKNYRSSK